MVRLDKLKEKSTHFLCMKRCLNYRPFEIIATMWEIFNLLQLNVRFDIIQIGTMIWSLSPQA